jgi:nucleoid-associated protein YgaU
VACLSCVRPGLPLPGALSSSIRTTLGTPVHPYDSGSTSRVGRSYAASAGAPDAVLPAGSEPGAEVRRQRHPRRPPPDSGGLLRLLLVSLVLAAALFGVVALVGPGVGTPTPTPGQSASARTSPTAVERTPSPQAARTYVVRSGDTLHGIALRFYGEEGLWELIYDANRARIPNPDSLVIGTELVIPPRR